MKKPDLDNNKFLSFLYCKRSYFIAFFVPMIILYAVFIAFEYYPFGDYCPLVLDLNGQYIYYYEHLHDVFWGDADLLYSWSRNLGGEMLGIYGYYLASPFMIIVALLPRKWILTSVMIMQLLKVGTSGVAFNYYMRKSKNITSYTSVIFSLLYALMGYMVVQLMDPMWLDGLIYLPFITYGIECLIEKKKKVRYIIPLALMFLAHFYIGWMIAIYCVIYFFVYLYFIHEPEEDTGFKGFMGACVRFGIGSLTAGAIAAVVILPTVYSLSLGKLEFSEPDYSLKGMFVLFDFFTKLLPQSYDTVRNEGLPFVYCGMLTVFMIPLYFMNSNIKNTKKVGYGITTVIIFLSMYLSTIDIVWHGLQVPNWLPYRYSFIFSFLLLMMAAEAFERIEGVDTKALGIVTVCMIAFVIIVQKFGFKHITSSTVWFSLICIIGYSMLVFYYKKNPLSKVMPFVFMVLVAGELFGNSLHTLHAIHTDVVFSKRSSYVNYIQTGRDVIDELYEIDDSFYRTEKTYHRTVNDPMAFRMRGVSHSSSTLNSHVIGLLDKLGYASRGHYVKYNGATKLTDDIFGIKYVLTKEEPVLYTETVLTNVNKNDASDVITGYKNDNALSVGYMVDNATRDLTFVKYNPFRNQNTLLSTLLGDDYTEYFVPIEIDQFIPENVANSTSYGHNHYTVVREGENAQLEYVLTAPNENPIYMFLACDYSGYEKKLNIWVNKEFKGVYFETDNYCIKPLGQFKKGENVSVITTLTKEEVYVRDSWFYYLDEEKLDSAIEKLASEQLNVTSFTSSSLKGTINVSDGDGKFLMLTIPYETGWNVYVDGEKVEYFEAASGLIGIDLPAGEHTIEMKFFPKELTLGIIITIAGLVALAVIWILETKKSKVLLKRLYS